ncbi:methyltransferase family protein [Streptomyces sp. 1114.5]|uniref:methyltransferase n=1 Tax=Streptomyces sp. 1114.5 TaxID=1938830 RepID=UPI000EAC0592|nr:class I SAM-dependent methyltransferase [Streptomyces sp. 1114.5]RKT08763.1 methyltransferase family protein [Streptomyces sp. 1114.5]
MSDIYRPTTVALLTLSALSARWRSENGTPPPRRLIIADDSLRADAAHRLACEGTSLLWKGDYPGALRLLNAMRRRAERRRPRSAPDSPADAFRRHRQERARLARILGMLLVPLDADHRVPLHRAPDVREACLAAYGPLLENSIVSLRELLGVIGAQQWRLRGVEVPALGARIHPHYGVFPPTRGEYVDLVARAPLPPAALRPTAAGHPLALDLGTGTGVLAAVLAKRGLRRVLVTDANPRALACAQDNAHRLGLADRIEAAGTALYPPGDDRAALVVCNPPWLPGRAASALDQGVYDPDSRMLHGFLDGLARRLLPGGEGWLVLSDLAELLGLRSRADLLGAISGAGLRVTGRLDTVPRHPRATALAPADAPTEATADLLQAARTAEVTSLWRLAPS